MNKIKTNIVIGLGGLSSLLSPVAVFAQLNTDTVNSVKPDGVTEDPEPVIRQVINILLFVVGVAAVIMLIIGAIRYVVSAGDQQAVAGAKNTILYAIVGIIVAAMAFAIVNYVLGPDGLGVVA